MQFQITDIEFDFPDPEDCVDFDKEDDYYGEIIDEVLATTWEVDDEDDLVEEITSSAGFCIKSIDYRHILK